MNGTLEAGLEERARKRTGVKHHTTQKYRDGLSSLSPQLNSRRAFHRHRIEMIKDLRTGNKLRVNRDSYHQVHMRTRRKILNNPRPTMLIFSSGHRTRKPLLSTIRITGRGNHAIQLLTSNRAIS